MTADLHPHGYTHCGFTIAELLIVLLIIAIVLRIDFFFTIFYLFAAVYALSHLWMQGTAKRVHVQRHFVDHAFCDDRVVVDVRVRNMGWLPLPWLEVHESLPVQLAAPWLSATQTSGPPPTPITATWGCSLIA